MGQPMRYEIVVKGRGGAALLAALEGFEPVDSTQGETRLVGWVVDQAALHAILERLRDLNVELREVHRIDLHD
jgi:hypothetical protein